MDLDEAMSFTKMVKSLDSGELIIPHLRLGLYRPDFEPITITVEAPQDRPPDGYFHPSTHPTWPERMLYWYLREPDKIIAEPLETMGVMAVTQGNFWHELIGAVGMRGGIFEGVEVFVQDPATKARGSMDWALSLPIGNPTFKAVGEFKTINPMRARKIPRGGPSEPMVVEAFRLEFPVYYAQAQEYMRLSGLKRWVGVFLIMQYPFEMREIHVPFDELFAYRVAAKYHNVLEAVARDEMPQPCCGPGSAEAKVCFARTVCPIALGRNE